MRDAPETRQAKSGTTNMPPLTRSDSSSKLDSQSNRRKHQTNTGRGLKHTAQGRAGGRGGPSCPLAPLPRREGSALAAARLTVSSHQALRGQTGRGRGATRGLRLGRKRKSRSSARRALQGKAKFGGGPEQREVGKQGPLRGPGDDHCLQASQARKSCGTNPAPRPWSPAAQQRRGQALCRRHPHPELALRGAGGRPPDDARPPQKSQERR